LLTKRTMRKAGRPKGWLALLPFGAKRDTVATDAP
jgi:hypothetical protein